MTSFLSLFAHADAAEIQSNRLAHGFLTLSNKYAQRQETFISKNTSSSNSKMLELFLSALDS